LPWAAALLFRRRRQIGVEIELIDMQAGTEREIGTVLPGSAISAPPLMVDESSLRARSAS
jgi:hypothetical protein